jgi:hypothetical protein
MEGQDKEAPLLYWDFPGDYDVSGRCKCIAAGNVQPEALIC